MTAPLSEAEKQWLEHFERKLARMEGSGFQTAFLDPRELELAEAKLGQHPHFSYSVFGGYPQAERNILNVFPAQHQGEIAPLEAVLISWSEKATLSHRDLLGALMSLGFERDQVGDIITTAGSEAAVIVSAEKGHFICANLKQAGRTNLACQMAALDKLPVLQDEGRLVRGTVASLRADAVLSLGFALPRSRVVIMIKGGLVKVNYRPVSSPSYQLKEGDQVSLRGKGRLLVSEVSGKSRKGRTHLKLKKYS